jgi:processive 1,2-diacylglycerol beta-glucosyltransferase
MKIFILYASAGSGHAKAAEAVYDYLKVRPGLELELIDVLSLANPSYRKSYTGLYSFGIRYCNWLWKFCYWVTAKHPFSSYFRNINSLLDIINTKDFSRRLIKEKPDLVISTHFLPPEIVSHLKKGKHITSRLITIITDYGSHPYWISGGVDIYIVPSERARNQLILEGASDKKIRVLGIPVAAKFLRDFDKTALRAKFGLAPGGFTVLIASGSFGIGPIEKIVDLIHQDVEVIVVCASNKKLYDRLTRKNYPRVKAFGFVSNMEELMAVSDIILTKPGGLTVAELLVMKLPPVFITAIPGQEYQNIRFLLSSGIGFDARKFKASQIRDIVLKLKGDPQTLQKQIENISGIKKNFSLEELINVIR